MRKIPGICYICIMHKRQRMSKTIRQHLPAPASNRHKTHIRTATDLQIAGKNKNNRQTTHKHTKPTKTGHGKQPYNPHRHTDRLTTAYEQIIKQPIYNEIRHKNHTFGTGLHHDGSILRKRRQHKRQRKRGEQSEQQSEQQRQQRKQRQRRQP